VLEEKNLKASFALSKALAIKTKKSSKHYWLFCYLPKISKSVYLNSLPTENTSPVAPGKITLFVGI
jgi:hypothetical protein